MTEIRRWVVERFFDQELEEDFRMGVREGIDMNRRITKENIAIISGAKLKKNQPGVALVLDALR